MSDLPPHAAPNTPAAEGRRRWPFTYTQFRLGILMSALAFGLTGMIRNQPLLFDIGLGFAVLGVAMRVYNRFRQRKQEG